MANGERLLAEAVLTAWITSDDPLGGETWDMWCDIAGYSPEELKTLAEGARLRNPRLPCGHLDALENLYFRYGRVYCRKCQSERRLAYFAARREME